MQRCASCREAWKRAAAAVRGVGVGEGVGVRGARCCRSAGTTSAGALQVAIG